jgi:hypothetical protein
MSLENVVANDGNYLPLESLDITFSYDEDDNLQHLQVVNEGLTYRQTITRNEAGKITHITKWELQS